MNLTVKTQKSSYDILIENGVFDKLSEKLSDIIKENKAFVVTDDNVNRIYGGRMEEILQKAGVRYHIEVLKSGEQSKSFNTLVDIFDKMTDFEMTRSDCVIAFGGGVIGDTAGFAAASYLRGVKLIQIPTTLLSQVDSSVGGKVAVNLKSGKNLVGSFYPPNQVFIDPALLKSLPSRVFNDGMAEVIKYGAIKDESLFSLIENNYISDILEQVIIRCVSIKKEIVEKDEFDTGERMLLNFGHTFGHVVEALYNYSKYTHGEAVAAGMLKVTEKTEKMGVTPDGTYERLANLLKKYNLLFENIEIDPKKGTSILLHDKKGSSTHINYVILNEIGSARIMPVSRNENFLIG